MRTCAEYDHRQPSGSFSSQDIGREEALTRENDGCAIGTTGVEPIVNGLLLELVIDVLHVRNGREYVSGY